jgi:uncharacterized protein (TIGR00297 family)
MIAEPGQIVINALVITTISLFSHAIGILDRTGFTTAFLVGLTVVTFGDWTWLSILVSFLLVAGAATRFRYKQKAEMGAAESKRGARTWQNVLANGAVATVSAVLFGVTVHPVFAAAFLGAVSTSAADTLATELGLLYPYEPTLITDLRRRVRPGTSGGVTLLGEVASTLGALVIGVAAVTTGYAGIASSRLVAISLAAGLSGSTVDSLLGATVQAVFRCPGCGGITEKTIHCEESTALVRGTRWVDNNTVNFLSTIAGSAVAALMYLMSL